MLCICVQVNTCADADGAGNPHTCPPGWKTDTAAVVSSTVITTKDDEERTDACCERVSACSLTVDVHLMCQLVAIRKQTNHARLFLHLHMLTRQHKTPLGTVIQRVLAQFTAPRIQNAGTHILQSTMQCATAHSSTLAACSAATLPVPYATGAHLRR